MNEAAPPDRRWLGLFGILAAMIMNILDSTIVNTAAPSIRRDLGGSYSSLQWIAAAYTLALAVGLLTGGRLGDMFGRRRVMLTGIVSFVGASVLCAFAWSPESLIAARVLQGLFGALMVPQSFGLIRDLFPPKELGKAFGALGPVIGMSTILGPVVAGLLISADLFGTGWRLVFLINLLLGAFALVAGVTAFPAAATHTKRELDVVGTLLGGAGMFTLVYPLVQGRESGWPAWCFAMLPGSVVILGAFALYQLRRQANGKTPLVELSVFAKRSYTSGVVFVLVFFGTISGFSLSVGLFLQVGWGYSAMKASSILVAWSAGAFVGSGFAATTMTKLGRRLLHIGLTIMTLGAALLYMTFSHATTDFGTWTMLLPLFVFGAGMGMIFVPLFDIIMAGVEDHEVGSASSMLESVQQLGASLGVALLGTLFFGTLGAQAAGNFDTAQTDLRTTPIVQTMPLVAQDQLVQGVKACLVDRENATDPDTVPVSCTSTANVSGEVGAAVGVVARDVHRQDAIDAAKDVAALSMLMGLIAFALAFLLPSNVRSTTAHEAAPADDRQLVVA